MVGASRLVPILVLMLMAASPAPAQRAAPVGDPSRSSSSLAADFDARVRSLEKSNRTLMSGPRGIGLDPYLADATALARAHGSGASGYLRTRLDEKDPHRQTARPLALLTLALLADAPAAAILADEARTDPGAFSALTLTYAPPETALRIADEALARPVVNRSAVELATSVYRFFGDAARADAAEAVIRRANFGEWDRASRGDLVALRQRLAHAAAERDAWHADDLAVWRSLRSLPGSISVDIDLATQTRALCRSRRFATAYLRDRLAAAPCDWVERKFLFLLAAEQPDPTFVPILAPLAGCPGPEFYPAIFALAPIGTREALAPIEALMGPPEPVVDDKPMRLEQAAPPRPAKPKLANQVGLESRGAFLARLLTPNGDRTTLQIFARLADDPDYPEGDRKAFAEVRDAIRRRLGVAP